MVDLYCWTLAPVADAFGPPSPVVIPDHVGYAVQRYLENDPRGMGEVIVGFRRLPDAQALCDALNRDPSHPSVRNLPRRKTYL